MRPTTIRLLTLALAVTAVSTPVMTATAGDSIGRHVRKHHKPISWNNSVRRTWAAGEIRTVASPAGGDVCPGNARSFDCKIWPPPIYDDPDRKGTGGDGM